MTISLTPEQQAWLTAHVARGEFASIEEAVRQLIDERIAERTAEECDDLVWARAYVDEALAEVGRGEFLTLDEHRARNAARLAALKDCWRALSSPQPRTRIQISFWRTSPAKPVDAPGSNRTGCLTGFTNVSPIIQPLAHHAPPSVRISISASFHLTLLYTGTPRTTAP